MAGCDRYKFDCELRHQADLRGQLDSSSHDQQRKQWLSGSSRNRGSDHHQQHKYSHATQDSITINGFGFSATAANNTISFNLGAVGRVTSSTATQLSGLVTTRPTSLGNLTAVVTTNSVGSGSPVQVGGVRPTVTAATASLAITANTIIIAGTRFDSNAGNNTVVFNNGAVGNVTSVNRNPH